MNGIERTAKRYRMVAMRMLFHHASRPAPGFGPLRRCLMRSSAISSQAFRPSRALESCESARRRLRRVRRPKCSFGARRSPCSRAAELVRRHCGRAVRLPANEIAAPQVAHRIIAERPHHERRLHAFGRAGLPAWRQRTACRCRPQIKRILASWNTSNPSALSAGDAVEARRRCHITAGPPRVDPCGASAAPGPAASRLPSVRSAMISEAHIVLETEFSGVSSRFRVRSHATRGRDGLHRPHLPE
jgi:hypothetical protein